MSLDEEEELQAHGEEFDDDTFHLNFRMLHINHRNYIRKTWNSYDQRELRSLPRGSPGAYKGLQFQWAELPTWKDVYNPLHFPRFKESWTAQKMGSWDAFAIRRIREHNDLRGFFTTAQYGVLKQVHPTTGWSLEAAAVVNDLIVDLVDVLMAEIAIVYPINGRRTPDSRTVQTAVRMVLPGELAKHAVSEGTKAVCKSMFQRDPPPAERQSKDKLSRAAGLVFPVTKFRREVLRLYPHTPRLPPGGCVYLCAVLEYITAEVLELAGNVAMDNGFPEICPRHIARAIENDEELSRLFKGSIMFGTSHSHWFNSYFRREFEEMWPSVRDEERQKRYGEGCEPLQTRAPLADPRDMRRYCSQTLLKETGVTEEQRIHGVGGPCEYENHRMQCTECAEEDDHLGPMAVEYSADLIRAARKATKADATISSELTISPDEFIAYLADEFEDEPHVLDALERFDQDALAALHVHTENHVAHLFMDAYLASRHARKDTVDETDMELVARLKDRGHCLPGISTVHPRDPKPM